MPIAQDRALLTIIGIVGLIGAGFATVFGIANFKQPPEPDEATQRRIDATKPGAPLRPGEGQHLTYRMKSRGYWLVAARDQDRDLRKQAATALGAIAAEDPSVVEPLITMLVADDEHAVRTKAARSLARLATKGVKRDQIVSAFLKHLRVHMNDAKSEPIDSVVIALSALSGEKPDLVKPLRKYLTAQLNAANGDARVVDEEVYGLALVESLAEEPADESLSALISLIATEDDYDSVESAFGRIAKNQPDHVKELVDRLLIAARQPRADQSIKDTYTSPQERIQHTLMTMLAAGVDDQAVIDGVVSLSGMLKQPPHAYELGNSPTAAAKMIGPLRKVVPLSRQHSLLDAFREVEPGSPLLAPLGDLAVDLLSQKATREAAKEQLLWSYMSSIEDEPAAVRFHVATRLAQAESVNSQAAREIIDRMLYPELSSDDVGPATRGLDWIESRIKEGHAKRLPVDDIKDATEGSSDALSAVPELRQRTMKLVKALREQLTE